MTKSEQSREIALRQIRQRAEWSRRHGAYALAVAKSIGFDYPQVTFAEFHRILVESGATGFYAKEAIRNAWNSVRLAGSA